MPPGSLESKFRLGRHEKKMPSFEWTLESFGAPLERPCRAENRESELVGRTGPGSYLIPTRNHLMAIYLIRLPEL